MRVPPEPSRKPPRIVAWANRNRVMRHPGRPIRHPGRSHESPAIQTHAGKPCLAARTYNARTARSVPRSIATARMGEALFGGNDLQRQDAQPMYSLHAVRERSRPHAWAKPCLAGRPTALVRTQPPEQNTSHGRPSGMELPDYPVMVLTPTPTDQDGPTLRFSPGLFPYPYLVTLPTHSSFLFELWRERMQAPVRFAQGWVDLAVDLV
jgi:hypothetical protein